MPPHKIGAWIISISKLLGNYNYDAMTGDARAIISISKLLGNYNSALAFFGSGVIISISKLLGNYNENYDNNEKHRLYQYLNC